MEYGEYIDSDYENYLVKCPFCLKELVFNRREDLLTFEPIVRKEVECLNTECKQSFRLKNDTVNLASELFLQEAERCFSQKKYMMAVVLSTQAIESFFSLFLKVQLTIKPFCDPLNLDGSNHVLHKYTKVTKSFPYKKMSNTVVSYLYHYEKLSSVNEITCFIDSCKGNVKKTNFPIDSNIQSIIDLLNKEEISTLRNKVAHKMAYRPTREEADYAIDYAFEVICKLQNKFKVNSDKFSYYQASYL
ncbi:hypothetical protein ATY36_20365 [Vibrio cidicii]|uniref:hypothetical protein n=1 Tax=Vibrio cidicii TaxID=1763883 RepID=UPI00078017C6|nr:hypothetical protein [Vibrio cidicii]KYN88966.1 hypothetical protein ATY36_20365 [Vibrio cidicii]